MCWLPCPSHHLLRLPHNLRANPLIERRRPLRNKQLLSQTLGNTVRKRELEVLGEELLDVWSLDVVGLFNLDDLEDLYNTFSSVLNTIDEMGFYQYHVRELIGNGLGGGRPYPGTSTQPHRFLTSHGTPCTCCGCRSASRIGSRYRSS